MDRKYPVLKGNRYHKNADITSNTALLNAEHESNSGICSVCVNCGSCEIGIRAKTGHTIFPSPFGIAQFGAEKRMASLQDIQIIPELIGEGVFFTKVNTSFKIGCFNVSSPVSIASMGSTKIAHSHGEALAMGAAIAGIPCVIGENVYSTYGLVGLKDRIKPFIDTYINSADKKGAIIVQANFEDSKLGVPEKAVEFGAKAIELKLAQGSKTGLGGEITFEGDENANKYASMGYEIVKNPDGKYQRHSNPGDILPEKIKEKIVNYANLGVPIWLKLAFGKGIINLLKYFDDLKKKENLPIDVVTVDGFGGGTGMSPWLIMNECSLPSITILKHLKNLSFDLLVAGGFSNGIDVAKALMLGAKGVSMGRSMLIAANTNPKDGIKNYIDSINEDLKLICATQRVKNVTDLISRRDNLVALNSYAAELFGLKKEVI